MLAIPKMVLPPTDGTNIAAIDIRKIDIVNVEIVAFLFFDTV